MTDDFISALFFMFAFTVGLLLIMGRAIRRDAEAGSFTAMFSISIGWLVFGLYWLHRWIQT